MNFANSNYRTVLKKGSGLTKLTINGVDYFPTEDGELLLPSNFATTDQLFSGDYNDLSNKPTIPAAQVPSDWEATEGVARILNKPVLFSGDYNDLSNKPALFSGNYADLTGTPVLAAVATSGSYDDLTEKPVIPAAQVNSDWDATSGVAQILNKPTIPTVPTNVSAFTNDAGYLDAGDIAPVGLSGNYADLINKPDLSPLATAIQNASNVGTGTSLFSGKTGTNLDLRTLRAGDNVTISVNATGEIIIAAAGSSGPAGESNTASSLGTGISLVAPKNGVDLPFRSLLSSAGLTWSQETDTVTLTLDTALIDFISNNGYGIGKEAYTSLYDANALSGGSLYALPNGSPADFSNYPAGAEPSRGRMITIGVPASIYGYQQFADRVNNEVWFRNKSNTWSNWVKVWNSGNVPYPVSADANGKIVASAVAANLEHANGYFILQPYNNTTTHDAGGYCRFYYSDPSGTIVFQHVGGTGTPGIRLEADLKGNAYSASVLQTSRTINGVPFDGSSNITIQDDTKVTNYGGTNQIRLFNPSSNNVYMSFYHSDGSTRAAYIGPAGSTNDDLYIYAQLGSIRLYNAGAQKVQTTTTGITVTGTVTATSDKKFKKNIRRVKPLVAISRLMQLRVKSFFFTVIGKDTTGFIAQDVRKIYPNSVDRLKGDKDSHLVMSKDEIIADLVVVVQDQQKRLDAMERKLNDLT